MRGDKAASCAASCARYEAIQLGSSARFIRSRPRPVRKHDSSDCSSVVQNRFSSWVRSCLAACGGGVGGEERKDGRSVVHVCMYVCVHQSIRPKDN